MCLYVSVSTNMRYKTKIYISVRASVAQWEVLTHVFSVTSQSLTVGFASIGCIFDSRLQRTKSRIEQGFSFCVLDETKNDLHTHTHTYI